jgi:hypothetical protein
MLRCSTRCARALRGPARAPADDAHTQGLTMRLGRYDNPYKCVSFAALDPAVHREPVALEAADGGISTGILYTCGRPRTALCFMHRRRT